MDGTFVYEYSRKNDGQPSPYSPLDRAVSEALSQFMFGGSILTSDPATHRYDWSEMKITVLPCNARENHYPDACWHYRFEITEA